MKALLSRFACGDMTVFYPWDPVTGRVGFWIMPTAMLPDLDERRDYLDEAEVQQLPWPPLSAWTIESLVQFHLLGEDLPTGFAQGRTLRNSPSVQGLQYRDQSITQTDDLLQIVTRLEHPSGCLCEHQLTYRSGAMGMSLCTRIINRSTQPLTLALLASFSLGGITPFAPADTPERLVLHQIRSAWSAEGRLVSTPIEQVHLERSWTGSGVVCERFGQVGTMPVRGFAPFVALEDSKPQVTWGAQLAWAGSWQMEVYRRDDTLALSGGLADREFGHWTKTLLPGDDFTTPEARLSVVHGSVDDLCQRLTGMHASATDAHPAVEADLPIIANEYCTSWGQPTHAEVVALAERLQGTPVRYLVIDAGWYAPIGSDWALSHGDWLPNADAFPQGLAATAAAIRQRGLIPGLWFEWETVGRDATAFARTEHLLHRDGVPITVGGRRFWDLTHPEVIAYLEARVMGLIDACDVGYLKIDYNETLGIGCDGTESLGEGLRRQVEAQGHLLRRLRERFPTLVIENCASGGHRLEPSLLALSSMGSFSDAHETPEIPIIAANLQRLLLPRQSQVWAVLRQRDTSQRLHYSLAATFLGRMCLSGDLTTLVPEQWAVVLEAMNLYRRIWPIIKEGHTVWFGSPQSSYRHPQGWQGIVRYSADGTQALAVLHTFARPPTNLHMRLRDHAAWTILDRLTVEESAPQLVARGTQIQWQAPPAFHSGVLYLQKKEGRTTSDMHGHFGVPLTAEPSDWQIR